MPSCVIKWCKNRSNVKKKFSGVSFHRFPIGNEAWKSDWVALMRNSMGENDWIPNKFSAICSMHFDANDFYLTKKGYRRLVTYAVPKMLFEAPAEQANGPSITKSTEQCDLIHEQPSSSSFASAVSSTSMTFPQSAVEQEIIDSDEEQCSVQPSTTNALLQSSSMIDTTNSEPTTFYYYDIKQNAVKIARMDGAETECPVQATTSNVLLQMSSMTGSVESASTSNCYDVAIPIKQESVEQTVSQGDFQLPLTITTPRERGLKETLLKKQTHIQRQKLKIKTLNQKVRRLESRNKSLNTILLTFKRHGLLKTDIFNGLGEIALDIFNNCKRKKDKKNIILTPAMKKFCLTLYGHSPKAYDYVRTNFNFCIPHPKTLYKWCSYTRIEKAPESTKDS